VEGSFDYIDNFHYLPQTQFIPTDSL